MATEPPRHGCTTCGRKWTGDTESHCRSCHQQFSTVTAFDEHRGDRSHVHPRGYCIVPSAIPTSGSNRTPKYRLRHGPYGDTWVLNKTDNYHAREAS